MDTETHELITGYALDALDAGDRARAEELLARSEEARDELRSFGEVVTALAVGVSGPAPRPELRERILSAARAEPSNVVPLDTRRRSRLAPALGAVAAVAAVAALAVGLWGASLSTELDDTRSALERERAAAAVLADPSARSVELRAGDGRLVVDDAGQAVLVLDDLEAAPDGKTYEVWVLDGDQPIRAGLFDGGRSREIVPVEESVGSGTQVLVTVENDGGVDAPTGAPVVSSARV